MNNLYILYFAVLLALSLSSCRKEIAHPPQRNSRLVVFSYIKPNDPGNPNDLITVSVSLSRSAFGRDIGSFQRIEDADVWILNTSSGVSRKILWNETTKQYELNQHEFSIQAGQTYKLKVSAHGQSISAQTSIPEAVKNPTFKLLGIQKRVKEHDSDQYRYQFNVGSNGLTKMGYYQFYPKLIVTSPHLNVVYGKDYLLANDHTNHKSIFNEILTLNYGTNKMEFRHVGVFVSCSLEYYLFQRSAPVNLESAHVSDFIRPQVGNIYSNMKSESGELDGYGIFAGYNEVTVAHH